MTKAKRQNPKPFFPVKGEIYENAGGGRYLCESDGNEHCARFMNVTSGWTFIAKGIVRYDDGTIEWDFSTDGVFRPVPEIQDGERGQELSHRLLSLTNAMLGILL